MENDNQFIRTVRLMKNFSSVDDDIDMIIRCGYGCLMAKFDIKAAYGILPIHPVVHFLFGMKWQGKLFY